MDNMNDLSDFDELEDEDIIVVIDDDGVEHEYLIIDAVTHKGSNYMLVTPADYEDDDESDDFEACIIKEESDEGDDVIFTLVEDEIEFNEVAALFMENADEYGIEV